MQALLARTGEPRVAALRLIKARRGRSEQRRRHYPEGERGLRSSPRSLASLHCGQQQPECVALHARTAAPSGRAGGPRRRGAPQSLASRPLPPLPHLCARSSQGGGGGGPAAGTQPALLARACPWQRGRPPHLAAPGLPSPTPHGPGPASHALHRLLERRRRRGAQQRAPRARPAPVRPPRLLGGWVRAGGTLPLASAPAVPCRARMRACEACIQQRFLPALLGALRLQRLLACVPGPTCPPSPGSHRGPAAPSAPQAHTRPLARSHRGPCPGAGQDGGSTAR